MKECIKIKKTLLFTALGLTLIICISEMIYSQTTSSTQDNYDERVFPSTPSYIDFDKTITEDIDNTIISLKDDFEKLCAQINTYVDYKNSICLIEEYYHKIDNDVTALSKRIETYCFEYSELIIYSDKSLNNKYYEFNDLFECLYVNARNKIYDQIYIEILSDIYDKFYNGILNDAQNRIPWDEWTQLRANEYTLWSSIHSKIYDIWFNLGYKIYNFTSDIQTSLSDNDIEKTYEILESFEETMNKQKKD